MIDEGSLSSVRDPLVQRARAEQNSKSSLPQKRRESHYSPVEFYRRPILKGFATPSGGYGARERVSSAQ